MKRKQIETAFRRLNELLKERGIKGEVGVVGGAAMVLAFNARKTTKDVDAIFKPSREIRDLARQVASDLQLPTNWLNDTLKGFPKTPRKDIILEYDHLLVWVPQPEYFLAMKAISARLDSQDAQDLRTLCRILKITEPQSVISIVAAYYPRNQIPAKTVFFVEKIFNEA